jgi:hypothetical protein
MFASAGTPRIDRSPVASRSVIAAGPGRLLQLIGEDGSPTALWAFVVLVLPLLMVIGGALAAPFL